MSTIWAMGDYDRFARATVWELGPVLVDACAVAAGQRVLDVAAGTGNVAIRAAMKGASVVASDLTPANFEAGRCGASAAGVSLEWVESDAEALPFEERTFDVVTSCFGVMFAPDHQKAAGELVRVCRPGGTIGLMSFTPEGIGGAFFSLFASYAPAPPPDGPSPLAWGDEKHVRSLFGGVLTPLTMSRRTYVERAESPEAYCALYNQTFGPLVAMRASLTAERQAELDRRFLASVIGWNGGRASGPVEVAYEYLLVVGRKAAQP